MSDRLRERLHDRAVAHDTRLLGDFAAIYCRGSHEGTERRSLESVGVREGVYRRVPVVCAECAELLVYAEQRRAFCPKDPKPFCTNCDTHCYKPDMREAMREVMRYAGPRSMFHGHAVDGIKHLIESRKHKRAAARREEEAT